MDTNKLKIVFLTAYCSEQGTYFRWHNFAIGLSALGHNVQVFCVDESDLSVSRCETRDGIGYHILKSSKGKSFFGNVNNPMVSLRRVFVDYPECDILHIFQPFLSVYMPWRFKLKKKAKITFFDWDDLWVDALRDKEKKKFKSNWDYSFTGFFEKKIPSNKVYMTVCSNLLKKLALNRGATSADILPNGFWAYEVPDKRLSREKLRLKSDDVYFGFMGRTGFELHWCFDALEKCIERGINIRLALCGPPESEMNNIPEKVRANIDYLGSLKPSETRYFAAAIDLGLLPLMKTDFNESRFPIKFAEYQAAGLPVLCSEIGEVSAYGKNFPWVINAGVTQEDWTTSFIMAAKMVMDNEIAKVDRKMIMEALSWDVINKQLEQIYLSKIENFGN